MVWIIGEYADRIDNAAELLEQFVENFHTEQTAVQLQLLTAVVCEKCDMCNVNMLLCAPFLYSVFHIYLFVAGEIFPEKAGLCQGPRYQSVEPGHWCVLYYIL